MAQEWPEMAIQVRVRSDPQGRFVDIRLLLPNLVLPPDSSCPFSRLYLRGACRTGSPIPIERRRIMGARSKRMLFRLVATAVLVCAVDSMTASQSRESTKSAIKDPVFGTWILNLAKSKYTPGPPPKSQVRTYEPNADGVHALIKTVEADGRQTTIEYTAKYDGV